VIETKEELQKPVALNTVEMLRYASTVLGFDPKQTMHIAQRLYTNGYIR